MKKIRILAIAPYEGMAETLSSQSQNYDNIEITVQIGNLYEGLRIAKDFVYLNYDIIISRGGTADLIRAELDTPVIDAPLSTYDLLRSIKMAENFAGKFAIAGFQSITNSAKMLCDLLQMPLDIFTFDSSENVVPIMKHLKEENYGLVVCDMIGTVTAQELGMNSILIPSGTESINQAIDEAIKLVSASHYIYKQNDIFKQALTNDHEKTIIFDQRGNIWFSTLSDAPLDKQLLNMAQTFLPAFVKTDGQVFERQFKDLLFIVRNRHIVYEDEQYTLLRITQKEALFDEEDKSISIYNKNEDHHTDFSTYYNSANYVGTVQKQVNQYSETTFPILITGEVGTGKDKAATIIYKNGPYQNSPFYSIDCELLTERKWRSLINNENSPLSTVHTTIYFKNLRKLSKVQLSQLFTFFEQTNITKRNRLIFSLITDGEDNSIIYNYLTNQLSCLKLSLPPLRERIEDLSSISTLYINKLNASLGKQIVGFDTEAISIMKEFPWPHNLDQLRRIINELIIMTETSYITADNVRKVLSQEKTSGNIQVSSSTGLIDLTQTLDEINYQIIQLTLNDERMNKEKTAKRLGISRSTLWRILKTHAK